MQDVFFSPKYIQIPRENATLWRYMDFPRFVSMLQEKALFAPRPDQFSDSWDGLITAQMMEAYVTSVGGDWSLMNADKHKKLATIYRMGAYVSCWYESPGESIAMWQLYSQMGVAIKSSVNRLKTALAECDHRILFGKVRYNAYPRIADIRDEIQYLPYFLKRKCYAHEKEVRLVVREELIGPLYRQHPKLDPLEWPLPIGINLPIDLNEAIRDIYVSPFAPGWFNRVVGMLMVKYGYKILPKPSELLNPPDFNTAP